MTEVHAAAESVDTLAQPTEPEVAPQRSLVDRELSWLSFNARVLQEADDPSVPLFERLFFCGVFSSNLDEFFRVRVASLRHLLRIGKKDAGKLGFSPHRLLHDIHQTVMEQQARYDRILYGLMASLEQEGVEMVDHREVDQAEGAFLARFYEDELAGKLDISILDAPKDDPPFLANGAVYLVAELWPHSQAEIKSWAPQYGFVQLPSPPLPRFIPLPERADGVRRLMYLDDVLRFSLPRIFSTCEVGRAYAVMLTRDAGLYVDDVFDSELPEAIRQSLSERDKGDPSRFLYDMRAPYVLIHQLQHALSLKDEDLLLGGRYHSLGDLMAFPRFDKAHLGYPAWPALPHPELENAPSVLAKMAEKDIAVHTPYQSFDHVVAFIEEAARDPDVDAIWLTVYRVARDSLILNALIAAARAGKRVVTFMEIQARFDEEANLEWAERLEAAGATVIYPTVGLKVHAKLAMVVRREGDSRRRYAYVGTGNFNEKTARIYADHGILTADPEITADVEQVFGMLGRDGFETNTAHLMVAPCTLRTRLYDLIRAEADAARRGEPSGMILKMNGLEDAKIIDELYEASRAGVPIRIIVRGICRLVPGVPGQSETIEVRSILDRYLEHARIFLFHNGGDERMYLASSDWMNRNLSKRVEVAIPVLDPEIRRQLRVLLTFQLEDNVKARVIDGAQGNRYASSGDMPNRSQESFRNFLATLRPDANLEATPIRKTSRTSTR